MCSSTHCLTVEARKRCLGWTFLISGELISRAQRAHLWHSLIQLPGIRNKVCAWIVFLYLQNCDSANVQVHVTVRWPTKTAVSLFLLLLSFIPPSSDNHKALSGDDAWGWLVHLHQASLFIVCTFDAKFHKVCLKFSWHFMEMPKTDYWWKST